MRLHAPPPDPSPDLLDSPLYLLAVLFSARRSKDGPLERVTRRRLDSLGIRIAFGKERLRGGRRPATSSAAKGEVPG